VRTAGDSWRPIARPWHWGNSSGTKRYRLRCAHVSRSSCSTASRVLPSAPPLSYGRRAGARGCSSPLPRTHGRRVRQRHSPHAPVAHHRRPRLGVTPHQLRRVPGAGGLPRPRLRPPRSQTHALTVTTGACPTPDHACWRQPTRRTPVSLRGRCGIS